MFLQLVSSNKEQTREICKRIEKLVKSFKRVLIGETPFTPALQSAVDGLAEYVRLAIAQNTFRLTLAGTSPNSTRTSKRSSLSARVV